MGIEAQSSLPVFQQPARECVQPEEAPQQLRDELNPGSLKKLMESEEARPVKGQQGRLLQTREVKSAGEGVPVPVAEHTAGR
jgi:hypothetical protein